MGGTYYTLETGALKVMEDFFVYANIFSVKNTTDNTDLFEKILSIILFVIIMLLSFLGLLKSLIFLIYFLMFNISNYCHVLTTLLCSGCKINLCKALKNTVYLPFQK